MPGGSRRARRELEVPAELECSAGAGVSGGSRLAGEEQQASPSIGKRPF